MTVTGPQREVAVVPEPGALASRGPTHEPDLGSFASARGPALLRLAWLLTADADAAQDLVQDALARVLPRWPKIVARGDPEAYVRAAIRSAWTDRWRRQRRLLPGLGPTDRADTVADTVAAGVAAGVADAAVEGAADRLDLAAALARLTDRQRTVLVLRFYEDLTEAQTAAVMRCSVNTVKSQARHALQRLRALAPDLIIDSIVDSGEVDR